MRYLWQHPARLDNTRLRAFLGQEPHTPLDAAVCKTLEAMGCGPTVTTSPRGHAEGTRPLAQERRAGT